MPRAVPAETARRRRERLSELIDALGAARGQRVTQREFAASIGREQGTVAAILGGDRALGADVMMAVVQAYRLPSDWFDRPLRPDPRPFARAAVNPPSAPEEGVGVPSPGGGQAFTAGAQAMSTPEQAMPPIASAMHPGGQAMHGIASAYTAPPASDGALGEALAALAPDRSVAIALEALARRGVREDTLGWERLVIGAQSAQDLGILLRWFDETLAALSSRAAHAAVERAEEPSARPSPRVRQRG
ncbi:MAG: hypothetical protein U0324_22410 [Polyangiales bacterium]